MGSYLMKFVVAIGAIVMSAYLALHSNMRAGEMRASAPKKTNLDSEKKEPKTNPDSGKKERKTNPDSEKKEPKTNPDSGKKEPKTNLDSEKKEPKTKPKDFKLF